MSVVLDVQGCDAPAEIVRIVETELDQPITRPPGPVPNEAAGGLRIAIACDATTARVRVTSDRASVARTVGLADTVPESRARLIALVAVELVSTSTSQHAPPETVPVAPAPAPPPPLAIDAGVRPVREPAGLHVAAFGGGVIFDSNTGLLGGGGLRLSSPGAPVGWLVDVGVFRGESEVSNGHVNLDLIDASAAISIGHAMGRFHVALAGGLRGGIVRLAGTASSGMATTDRFWAPWFGAFALANAELRVAPRLTLHLAIEGGGVISPVGALVDNVREAGVDGAWLGVRAGIGMIL